jgi:hypothetical protein
MFTAEKKASILRKAEAEAKRGNKMAMNMLHRYDLTVSGGRWESLNIPSEGGVRFIPKPLEDKSLSSTSAGW